MTVGDDDGAPRVESRDSHWEGTLQHHNQVILLVSFFDEDRGSHPHYQLHHFLQVY